MEQPDALRSRSGLRQVEVRVVEGFTGLSTNDRRAWGALFERQSNPLPFQSLSWNEAWWEVFGRSSRLITKDPVILVLSDQDEIIAFFPMFRVTLSVLPGIPLLRHVKPMGSDPNVTEVKLGVVAEGREKDAYAALVNHFIDVDHRWELVTLPTARVGVDNAVDAPPIKHSIGPLTEGFIIALAADWDAFHRGLKRNVKEAIRKCHNSLKRDGLKPVFTSLSDSAAILDMLPEFYRLHSLRANERIGVRHPDYFQSEESRSLIDQLLQDPVNSGIRLFVMKDGDKLIAARLAFEAPRGVYLYYSGYDPEYGKYSIMTGLVVEILKRSIACGQQYVHLSFGRDRSKTRWSPREISYEQKLINRNSLRGRFAAALYLAVLKRRRNALARGCFQRGNNVYAACSEAQESLR